MADTLAKPPTAEAIPEFPSDFPVDYAIHPIGRLEQVWDFLPPEYRAHVLDVATAFREARAELTALERAIPQEALEAANERRKRWRQQRREEAALRDPAEAEAEWEAIKQGLDANRAANSERLLFP